MIPILSRCSEKLVDLVMLITNKLDTQVAKLRTEQNRQNEENAKRSTYWNYESFSLSSYIGLRWWSSSKEMTSTILAKSSSCAKKTSRSRII